MNATTTTVTLHRLYVPAFNGNHTFSRWSLAAYSGNGIDGSDDGGCEYDLPIGFELAESKSMSMEFYDAAGEHYSLCGGDGKPRLCGGSPVHYVDFPE